MLKVIKSFKTTWRLLSHKGRNSVFFYSLFLFASILFDGAGLWLISKASISWLDEATNANGIANNAIYGISLLIARSITVGLISYISFRQLIKEEVRLSIENYDSLQSTPFETAKEFSFSNFFDVTQQSPQVAIHTLIINAVTIVINLLNVIVIFALLWSFNKSTALGTLTYFLILGIMQHFILTRASSRIGEYKQRSFEKYQNDTLIAFRLSKVLRVMRSNTFKSKLEMSRYATGKSLVNVKLIQLAPRLTLEAGLVIGVIALYFVGQLFGSSIQIGTNIILFLLAGFRIIPILSFVQSLYVTIIGEMAYLETETMLLNSSTPPVKARTTTDKNLFGDREVLQLNNVSYSYPNSRNNAVNSFSFSFCKGKIYAIVGLPGSGKSTLMDLCLGLLEPSFGSISSLNESLVIGYVPQDTELFDGSIRSNIALEWDDEAIDFNAMSKTLAMASNISILEDFMSENSNAVNLSGGQKQLVCLLRALYRDPDILFLDEATSSLDNSSDNQINEMLQSEKNNRAVILIAHRMSSVKIADEIIFMESGSIRSNGTLEHVRSEVKAFSDLLNLSKDI